MTALLTPDLARRLLPTAVYDCVSFGNDARLLLRGIRKFRVSRQTPEESYQALIRLHCKTRGWSNDALHRAVAVLHPPCRLSETAGVLGSITPDQIADYTRALDRDGYIVFPNVLPPDLIDRLTAFSLTVPCQLTTAGASADRIPYDRAVPRAERYMLPESDLIANTDVQDLMADSSLLAVAQAYLGCAPVLDIVAMWWNARFSSAPSSEAAQLYHFDMDRIKWLKFFFYLTDVTPETGPHCYIRGSHCRFAQPKALLRRGYARLSDEEILQHYPVDDCIEICGPRGSIIAVDTRGFHKGKAPVSADRLILQFEFADSLFGGAYRTSLLPERISPRLQQALRTRPRLYSKFDVSDSQDSSA